jgi:8-oxo-dGTP pyrophosphatase MutT (NUDIX family)
MMSPLEILSQRDSFLRRVVDKLGTSRIDFCETFGFISAPRDHQESWRPAGVLLPLFFRERENPSQGQGDFVFKLMKRSSEVVQSGDISCPGGMLHPVADPILSRFVAAGFPPVLRGEALAYARKRGPADYRTILLFLTNAVREAWEELGISPFNVRFLGPLPCRPLIAFTRVIFPVVGHVKRDWTPRPNFEVEKILELPLKDFFDADRYGLYTIETDYKLRDNISGIRHFPCFIAKDDRGEEEILWGATFSIVMSFFKIVFDFDIPQLNGMRTFKKVLAAEYLTGNQNKK